MKRPAAQAVHKKPAKKTKSAPQDEENDDQEEHEEEEEAEEEGCEEVPERSPEPPEQGNRLSQVGKICFVGYYQIMYALEVKALWKPRFEEVPRKDPRLILDMGVLAGGDRK